MYEIRVAGVVPEVDLRDMGAVTLPSDHVQTVLYGIRDQPALYGLLERIRALGLELVEVRRVTGADAEVMGEPSDEAEGSGSP